jgi:hypothetical protein
MPGNLDNYMSKEELTKQLIERTKRSVIPEIAGMLREFNNVHKTSNLTNNQILKVIREGMGIPDDPVKVTRLEEYEDLLEQCDQIDPALAASRPSFQHKRQMLERQAQRLREELGYLPIPAKP